MLAQADPTDKAQDVENPAPSDVPGRTGPAAGGRRDVVAIVNTSPDTVRVLQQAIEAAGFVVVHTFTWLVASGEVDLKSFLATHRPVVVVYDIAVPYERNWAFLQQLRETTLAGCRFVLTTVNTRHVEKLIGRDERVYEVVGRPADLAEIVRAVKEAARARPTR